MNAILFFLLLHAPQGFLDQPLGLTNEETGNAKNLNGREVGRSSPITSSPQGGSQPDIGRRLDGEPPVQNFIVDANGNQLPSRFLNNTRELRHEETGTNLRAELNGSNVLGSTPSRAPTPERGDAKCAAPVMNLGAEQLNLNALLIQQPSSVASKVQPSDATCPQSVVSPVVSRENRNITPSPADIYSEYCKRVDERKPFSEPTPIPGN